MRIASLQPSVAITVARLGRLDTLCAVTKYCVEAVPELAALAPPVLDDSWSFDKPGNLDRLLEAKPDLVIASVPYRMESLAAILKTGIPVLALAPHQLADVYRDMRLIARQVEAVDRAEAMIGEMKSAVAETRTRTAAPARQTVYCEEWGKPLIHSQAWVAELIDAAGGQFVGTPGGHTTADTIAAADPDVLLFAWCGAGDRVPLERVIEQRGWRQMRAVRSGRVFCIPDEFLNTPAFNLLDGLACIAAALHPAEFSRHINLRRIRE
ncbi:ABC transporter substrate-binding protein [Granulicella sp. WH15]|uniref:ABC transporter substrate-binding protein n=1 Tax=Granulicella sp. WH15 TaxID=2602070 RepID=UPI00136748CE|nr:ABC transporter substrate-binding protein [Granulicella sp. WH15]QHN03936.1 ABC transporter substrate-binding protein [Granulicella sp. WH15]